MTGIACVEAARRSRVATRLDSAAFLLSVLVVTFLLPATPAEAFRTWPLSRDRLADFTVKTWNEHDGLPAGRIRAIDQDRDGFLWLATDSGLVRFDGVRFQTWRGIGDARLPVGAVTTLKSGRDGSLWVGVSGRSPVGRDP